MTQQAPEPLTSREARKNFKAVLDGPHVTVIAKAWWTEGPCEVRALILPLKLNPYYHKENRKALATARKQINATLKLLKEAVNR
jgi:hypothetical protein